MPCPKAKTRVDAAGRAYKGSQQQIQSCVNFETARFNAAVADALKLPTIQRDSIQWRSPLAEHA
ncbi:MAG: hypothetical protein ACRD1L_07975, partial [Terriglobales bacterium]